MAKSKPAKARKAIFTARLRASLAEVGSTTNMTSLWAVRANHILFLDEEGVTMFQEHPPLEGARVEGARLVDDGPKEG